MDFLQPKSPGHRGTIFLFSIIIATIAASIIVQIYFVDRITISNWDKGCDDPEYRSICRATTSVLRFSISLVAFLCIEFVGTFIHAVYFDIMITFKFFLYCGIVVGFFFVTSSSMLEYAWAARFIAFIFLVYQQIILIDFAYTWNANWVEKSEASDNYSWLYALMATSGLLFAGSGAVMGILFWQFWGCPENEAILIITVILCFSATSLQIFVSETGSLLTSAIVCAYSTYLCYASITLNPDTQCNPTLSTQYQNISQGIGIGITVISLAYTSYTTVKAAPIALSGQQAGNNPDITAVVTGGAAAAKPADEETGGAKTSTGGETTPVAIDPANYRDNGIRQLFLLVIAIFITISAYYAMVLTNWATLQSGSAQNNPRTGTVAVWLQACGQWVALLMYIWSLVAPKMFPDRDFS